MHFLITVTYGWSAFPSSQRRGGAKRRGGQFGETLRRSDHPGCAASVASRHSFDGAATPKLRSTVLRFAYIFVPEFRMALDEIRHHLNAGRIFKHDDGDSVRPE